MGADSKTLKNNSNSTNSIVKVVAMTGIMAALSTILRMLEFPLLFMAPEFLKFDFSDLPALITAFAAGPLYGVIVEAIKNIIMLPMTKTQYVGELANFLVGGIFVFSAGFLYKLKQTRKGALIGMISGTLIMSAAASFLNYFLLIPFFAELYIKDPIDTKVKIDIIVSLFTKIFPFIKDLFGAILFSIIPFNLLKGFVISFITFLVYKRISAILKKY